MSLTDESGSPDLYDWKWEEGYETRGPPVGDICRRWT